jgi:hypothetical protein
MSKSDLEKDFIDGLKREAHWNPTLSNIFRVTYREPMVEALDKLAEAYGPALFGEVDTKAVGESADTFKKQLALCGFPPPLAEQYAETAMSVLNRASKALRNDLTLGAVAVSAPRGPIE